MDTLTEVQLPQSGMLIIFDPYDGGFNVSMQYSPKEGLQEEDHMFYLAMGHGLLQLALTEAEQVTKLGLRVIKQIQDEQNAKEATIAGDTVNTDTSQLDLPGMNDPNESTVEMSANAGILPTSNVVANDVAEGYVTLDNSTGEPV